MTAKRMRLAIWTTALALAGALFWASLSLAQGGPARTGVIVSLDGPVTPPVAQYLEREIAAASAADADLIVLEIDTPGGLVDSMKTIIKAILASETPVATYVSPQGARSASAGLYIMYAAHVSAMAPATNTGAATPVDVGGAPAPGDDSPLEESPFESGEETKPDAPLDDGPPVPSLGDGGAEEPGSEPPLSEPEEIKRSGEPLDDGPPVPTLDDASESDAEPVSDGASDAVRDIADALEDIRPRGGDEPLSSPDALRAKVVNDSVAYIRALAEERGRNADWAEKAVREAASVSANRALELGVIDLIADDLDDLLVQIDGRIVETAAGPVTLETTDIALTRVEPTTVERILSFIANPNVAVILMSLATTGIIIEMWNPGSIFPGLVGVVCLLLGLYSFQVLPFNWLPLMLMGAGAIFIAIEAFTPTFGLAGLSGLGLFGVGMYFLFPEGFRVSPGVIAALIASIGALLALILFAIIGSRSRGPMIGGDAVRRREGFVDEWGDGEGWVIVEGERWRARSDKPLRAGDKVRVVEVDGLVLIVKQAKAGGLLGAINPSAA